MNEEDDVDHPVVHFEIIGNDPAALRRFYAELFGWNLTVGDASAESVSEPANYGFLDGSDVGVGVNGGIGGGSGFDPHVVFYVAVDDVEEALRRAESLGGVRKLGPEGKPGTLMVGQFSDPEGNLIGVAGPN